MKAEKGQLITFANGEKYIVVETIIEEPNIWHCFVSENQGLTVFCSEQKQPDGTYEYTPIFNEEELKDLYIKFDEVLNAQ